jgi:hypothetical protein
MNDIVGIVRAQMDALLELLEQARASRCRELREQAEREAAEIRRRARRNARERVRKAAREERDRLEHEIRMTQAEVDTELRRRARARDIELIRAGRAVLRQALAARWNDADGRREWTEAAIAEAGGVLLGRTWTLQHPAEWPAEERDAAIALATSRQGATVQAEADGGLEAGLRILDGGAEIDMSIAGLVANERRVEGELLAEFRHPAEGEAT